MKLVGWFVELWAFVSEQLRGADPTLLAMVCVTALVLLAALWPRRTTAPDYASLSFWAQRYALHPEPQEWYVRHADIAAAGFLTPQMLRIEGLALLDVGCGSSALAEDMHRAGGGACRITGIDFSAAAVEAAQDAEAAAGSWLPAADGSGSRVSKYRELDARDMCGVFADGSFDLVTDKGTLDGLVGGGAPAKRSGAVRVVAEVARVLGRGGTYVTVSVTDWALPRWREWLGLEERKGWRHFDGKRIAAEQGGKAIAVFVNAWTRVGKLPADNEGDSGGACDGDEQKKGK